MANLNRVLLIGNLTRDPELRYTPSGTPVANLRLAVNSLFKDQAGQRKEETCFVTVVVWSKQAELCNQYLKKGRSIFVEGRLIYRQWEAEGKTRSTMEVRADRVQFLGAPPGAGSAGTSGREEVVEPSRQPVDGAREEEAAVVPTMEGGSESDVPF
jgi:single-strand DNA-binding protein